MMSTTQTPGPPVYRPGAPLLFEPVFDFTADEIRIQSFDSRCTSADSHAHACDRDCVAASLLVAASLPATSVNVNLHWEVVAGDDSLADFIVAAARANGVAPPTVAIDVDDDITAAELEVFDAKVKNLHRDGIRIAFRIRQAAALLKLGFPPDFLKIGRELVAAVDRDASRRELLQSIGSVMRTAGRRIVAEGVETWAELRALRATGIQLIQGPLLCKPAGRTEFPRGCA